MKFSLKNILSITVVAVLIAAIFGENRRTTELNERIALAERWHKSFNHHSIECLPYYRKALAWEDPTLPFSKTLVANVERQQKLIESMPNCSETEVSVIEVATMDAYRYVYAIKVPKGKTAKAEFFSVTRRNDSINKHISDAAIPFAQPLSIDIPAGLSKLELIERTLLSQPARKTLLKKITFAKVRSTFEIKLNGKSVFSKSIPDFASVGSHPGWKSDVKKQLILDKTKPFHEFATFSLAGQFARPMGSGLGSKDKSFEIKFRLTAGDAPVTGVAND